MGNIFLDLIYEIHHFYTFFSLYWKVLSHNVNIGSWETYMVTWYLNNIANIILFCLSFKPLSIQRFTLSLQNLHKSPLEYLKIMGKKKKIGLLFCFCPLLIFKTPWEWMWWVNQDWLQTSTQLSSLSPPFKHDGKKVRWASSWVEIKTRKPEDVNMQTKQCGSAAPAGFPPNSYPSQPNGLWGRD